MTDINLFIPDKSDIQIDLGEVFRYLGIKNGMTDENLMQLASKALESITHAAQYRACYMSVPVKTVNGTVFIGDVSTESLDLEKDLKGCGSAYVFAATSGTGVDRAISRLSVTAPSVAVVADAVASEATEALCNRLNGFLKDGKNTRPRFSPGYGDLNIGFQRDLITMLDAKRKIGLTLTDSFMMIPTKSVTAIIGIMD